MSVGMKCVLSGSKQGSASAIVLHVTCQKDVTISHGRIVVSTFLTAAFKISLHSSNFANVTYVNNFFNVASL